MTKENVKILVVDDQPDIRLLLSEFLRIEGYSVFEASDGYQAINLAGEMCPALILMDIMMPGLDGLSAIQNVRAQDPLVGIIVLTAFSTEQHAIRALQVGADEYMHKPFDPTELRAKVVSVLEKHDLRRENRRLQDRLADILQHYLPLPVAQRLIDAPEMPSLGGERQEVTILFADLRGFTSFTNMTAPEELIPCLNRYLSTAAEAILNHCGTVDKFMGDGIMAIFNAPVADPHHLLNAVRAALDLHRRVRQMCEDDERAGCHPPALQFGVGIHTGEAVVGNVGAASLMNYTAIGDSVNMSKRLEECAAPGQILVSQAVVDALGARLSTRALDPIKIKGRPDPEPVFEVQGIVD